MTTELIEDIQTLREGIAALQMSATMRLPLGEKLVTDQKRTEEELLGLTNELENRIAQRTAQLKDAVKVLKKEVSRRKKTEDALRESEERFRAIFHATNDAIFILDLDTGGIVDVNHKMCEMYGYDRQQALQITFEDLSSGSPPYSQQDAWEWTRKAATGEPQIFEWLAKEKNGRLFWTEINMRRAAIGAVDRLILTVRDVTERKRAEQELAQYHDHLEELVTERTTEIMRLNKVLTENAVELRAANRAKSDFLANMSHELRTPLNTIIGFSGLLQEEFYGTLNQKQHEYVGNILDSSRDLLSLINDILDLSKVEAGAVKLEPAALGVRKLLAMSIKMLKEKFSNHWIQLSLETEPAAEIEILADERKLKQIMFNLLSNAVKFTPNGGAVRVAARRVSSFEFRVPGSNQQPETLTLQPETDFIEISVEDTGIGIKQEDVPKLFKPFSQLESAYSKRYEGTGLGLMLTRRLVELHGGRIWVESEFGKGSRFAFAIPVQQETKCEKYPTNEETP